MAAPLPFIVTVLLFGVTFFMCDTTEAVDFAFTNSVQGTAAGDRFDREIGQSGAFEIMDSSTKFIWNTFGQQSPADRKDVQKITLILENVNNPNIVAFTSADQIHLSAEIVGNIEGDLKTQIEGVLYHEMAHVWQWNGQDNAPSGLIEGVADYVRLTAGFVDSNWVKPGGGDTWDQGYAVTAYFLQYCESINPGFVSNMNSKLKGGWDLVFFNDLTGKSVDELWSDYKAKYASST